MEGTQQYKVFFVSGSTDIVEATSAAEARDKASKQFGRVQRVEIVDASYYDGPEDEKDEDDEEDDDDDEDDDEDNPIKKALADIEAGKHDDEEEEEEK
jgi:hypothetical protein